MLILGSLDLLDDTTRIKINEALPEKRGNMLIIPLAYSYRREYLDAFKESASMIGFDKEKIEVFDESDPGAVMQRGFDCFAVLGGNTFRLLYNVKRFGLDRFITEQVKNGAVYMGFSAGACITCENIEYLKNLDENNDISDGDFSALGLTDKYVLCHYNLRGMQDIIACRKILGMGTELFTLNDGDIRVL